MKLLILYGGIVLSSISVLGCLFDKADSGPKDPIKGIVYNKETGELMVGVTLTLDPSGATFITDSLGQYVLTGIEPGNYLVVASKENFFSDTVWVEIEAGMDTVINFVLSTSLIVSPDEIVTYSIPVSGTPHDPITYSNRNWGAEESWRYGETQKVDVSLQSDGTLNIAWTDWGSDPSTLYLTRVSEAMEKVGADLVLETGVNRTYFGGLTTLADNGLAYTFVRDANRDEFIFKITNASGTPSFQTIVIGNGNLETPGETSKQSPMQAASSRIDFNPTTGKIALYFGHLQMWPDMVKHQGGYLKFYDVQGNDVGDGAGNNGWLYSHNFDQRMKVDGSSFVLIGHGDAYPRSIPIRTIDANGDRKENTTVFEISGAVGDNSTSTQLGDVIVLGDGSGYVMTLASAESRSTRDVAFYRLDKDLNVVASNWITSYAGTDGEYAFNVKTAPFGNDVLLAWELVKSGDRRNVAEAYFAITDANGTILRGPTLMDHRFNINDDFFLYQNGDVGWVTGEANTLKVNRFKIAP